MKPKYPTYGVWEKWLKVEGGCPLWAEKLTIWEERWGVADATFFVLNYLKICYNLSMRVEIDQSGKLEETARHTFIASSNNKHFVIKVSSQNKKKLQKHFRNISKPRMYVYAVFASIVSILIKKNKHADLIVIDREYLGKDTIIKGIIQHQYPAVSFDTVRFDHIGKKSSAHYFAYGAAIKEQKVNLELGFDDIIKLLKKTGNA